MIFLAKRHILIINKLTVSQHGGNFLPPYNLLNEHALDYLVEIVHAKILEQELYPNIFDKAGVSPPHHFQSYFFGWK